LLVHGNTAETLVKRKTPILSKNESGGHRMMRLLWRCYRYLAPYRRLVAGAYLAMLAINILNVIIPQFVRLIVDRGISDQNMDVMGWAAFGLIGLALVRGLFTFRQGQWTEMSSQSVAYDLRNAIQNKLMAQSFSYHDRTETGQLLSRAVQDVERIRFLTGRATFRVVDGTVLFLATTALLLWMNPWLALLVIATLPFIANRALHFGSRYRPLSARIQDQLGVMTTRLDQNLRGMRVVKSFAQEDAEIARFAAENHSWFNLAAGAARLQAANMPLLNMIANMGVVFILWVGGILVIRDQLTLGELIAFTTYLGQLVQPLRRFGMVIPAIAMASASAERIFEILDTIPDVKDSPGAKPLGPIEGHVRFESVSFAYPGRHSVLEGITFEAKSGQIVALLGATGSGKSTVTSLISRFYDPSAGRISVDGYDIRTVTLDSLRGQIGFVLQETTLFAANVRENIAFGRPRATETEIIKAAQLAQAHDFILQMPEGYDTRVGERGVTLSGGQKQRLAIARALLTDPRILILDDAMASVDTETERLIQVALDRLMMDRTTFVIAHRLSTVRQADMVLLLEKGRIAARGAHEDLLQSSTLYAEIYDRQLRPQQDGATLPKVRNLRKGPKRKGV
jgi:ATP-binding cassette subfamily B protein